MDSTTTTIVIIIIILHIAAFCYAIYDCVNRRNARARQAAYSYQGAKMYQPNQSPMPSSSLIAPWNQQQPQQGHSARELGDQQRQQIGSPHELEVQKDNSISSIASLDQRQQRRLSPLELEAQKQDQSVQNRSERDLRRSVALIPTKHLKEQEKPLLVPYVDSSDVQHTYSLTSQYSIQAPCHYIAQPSKAHTPLPSRNPSNRVANYHTSTEYSSLINQDLTTLLDSDKATTTRAPRDHRQRMSDITENDGDGQPRLQVERTRRTRY